MKPGEILYGEEPIILNAGRRTVELEVANVGPRPVWISSHYPVFEVGRDLVFDRSVAWGMHLDIPAGDAISWRPGERRRVRLVAYGGAASTRGFHGLTDGPATPDRLREGLERAGRGGFRETRADLGPRVHDAG